MKFLENYRGYVKEAIYYPTFTFRQKRDPSQKFLIFGFPRSGSTLLVSLLDSHPKVHCEDELLYRKLRFPMYYIQCHARLSRAEVYGFKLLVDHFETQGIEDPATFFTNLYEDGYQVIYLKRRNLLRAALSSLYGYFLGKFHHSQSEGELHREKMRVRPQELEAKIQRFEYLAGQQKKILGALPCLEIAYEDDLLDASCHQVTIDKIADYLRIPSARVDTPLVKVATEDISDFVENSEEVLAFIRGTEYARYLDS